MNKKTIWYIDWGLIIPTAVLLILSLTTLFSINFIFFRNQLIFLALSFLAFLFFSQVNYKLIQMYSLPIYIVSLALLGLVLVLGIESRGSVRWVELFGFRLQLAEIFKPFLAISLSSFLVARKDSIKTLFLTICFLFPVLALIFLQPDLGNALIYGLVTILALIFAGFSLRYFLALIIPLGIALPLLWRILHAYQKERIITFFNPARDPLGTSYNAIQAIITVGSGMIMGRGLGQGTQSVLRFLPERHTDFIFATLSEELGFVGSLVVVAAFTFLLLRIFAIVKNCDDSFCKIFAGISFFIILIQFFTNIAMNIGILPIVGVTLPFFSYGGSSLLSNFIFLGLLSSISKSLKGKDALEIK